ncbi:S8 family serine peptidase, partial [bacterium]|nr:S8 family serine peptidase [bacterium]
GEVIGYTPHWIINGIVVRTTVANLPRLAARDDVDVVEADLVVELIEPVSVFSKDNNSRSRAITPGVDSIEADRVWNELGIDGTGALIGGLDTGVDGTHPSLSARYRGNNGAPHSECWKDGADLGHSTPQDSHGHGTHTMGTMAGYTAAEQIGVAPGSLWIADNSINQGSGGGFDNDIIAAFEWFADPDGNAGTIIDVPDVVQNSWGVNENFSGYQDCDSRWWAAIDNCEAAGVVVTWSAGNEGPSSTTLRSPADRATTAYNCFSVGSTQPTSPWEISSFSSRGPSGCGGAYAMKPEISAPGSDIYSAAPGGGYQYMSGTSMAGPHVAGVVALMRSANPNVDVITIKQVIMDTATDLGVAGEENTYGHGLINAYEAVLAVMGGYGSVEGIVTNSSTGAPIEGVLVQENGGQRSATTDDSGNYSIMFPAETVTLDFSGFGFFDNSATVTIPEDGTVVANVTMSPAPTAVISGHVYDFEGTPVNNASVAILDTPIPTTTTNSSGFYSIEAPTGTSYTIFARANGMGGDQHVINLTGDITVDFNLPDLVLEDFESASFLMYPWEFSGNGDWTIDNSVAYEGSYCAKSGAISDQQESALSVNLDITAPGDISFMVSVSTEGNYDYLRFYIDGVEQGAWDSEMPWTEVSFPVTAGNHTFMWNYEKDQSVSTGSDCGWIDYIVFPTIGVPLQPQMVVAPESIELTLAPGANDTRTITVGNIGEGELNFNVSYATNARTESHTGKVVLAKGEHDTNIGTDQERGSGGPDGFGYTWIDSDEAGGPAYNWFDISGLGNTTGSNDDATYGPFDLGFNMSFYGNTFNQVNVCTNGFLSFTSLDAPYTNQEIPSSGAPVNMIAPFWDDLNPNSGGQIYYYADNNRFIVQYQDVPHYPSGNPETFQVILNSDGSIVYQYNTLSTSNSSTVGIHNSTGDDGLQIIYNGNYLHDGLAILLASAPIPEPWLAVTPLSGTVASGDAQELTVSFNAADLVAGDYTGTITVAGNDGSNPSVTIDVTLHVGDDISAAGDLPISHKLGSAYPNPFNP